MSSSKRKTPQILSRPDKKQVRAQKPSAARAAGHGPGVWLLLLALMLATLAAYYPAWHGSMLWDDDRHITRSDLRSSEGLWRIWFDLGATQQYYPVVHSTFWVLHKFWDDNTLGYHLLNIVLHVLSAFLVALLLRQLAVPWAWLAAVIFALHPVHVESVAWISELKNILSGLFYLGAALAYLHFDKSRQKRLYALALSLFILALLSKTVTATLPAALLVTFWWQRGRLDWRRDALPLAPFVALGAAGGLLTAWVERTMIGAQGGGYLFTPIERCLIAGRVTWFYLGKLLWPTGLTFIYPRWQISQSAWWQYIYPLGLAVLLAGLWLLRKRSRAPLAAMLFFCGTLFPAMGFFNVYPFRYSFVADHFQYLASIVMIALFSASLAGLAKRWNIQPKPAEVAAILVLGGTLAVPTSIQSRQYANAETLYRSTISRNPTCWMAFNNLGNILQGRGRLEDAVTQYREALRLKPDYAEAHNNLGDALQGLGRLEEAMAQYKEALGLTHDLAGTYYNLGNALQEQGRLEEAVAQYREALKREPRSAETHCNLGVALDKLGRVEEAITHFREAVRLRPDYATARNNLGKALQRMGRFEEALIQHREALRLKPDFAEAYNGLGSALQGLGRIEEAVTQFHQALQLNPGLATAYFNLGSALHGLGRDEEAVTQYNQGLRLAPEIAGAHFNLGQILQGLGRLDEAAAQYKEAVKHDPGSAEAQNNLGVALAGMGRIEEATTHFRDALRLKPDHAGARANLARALALLKTP